MGILNIVGLRFEPSNYVPPKHNEEINRLVEDLRAAVRRRDFDQAETVETILDYVVNHPEEYG